VASSKLEIMMAAASHDVRNALAVISTATSLVTRRGKLDPADVPAMARIARATARVEYLVELMSVFASLEQGSVPQVIPAPCELVQMVDEVVTELRGESNRSIAVISDGPVEVTADRIAIRRAIATVLGNAIDYSSPQARVRLSIRRSKRGGTIETWNEGPPIAPALIDRIFQPFPHGRERTASRRSLGLGLYVAHALVRAHGGTMTASSSEAEGTTFTITLPA
jgi:signal transduction histidine kinase